MASPVKRCVRAVATAAMAGLVPAAFTSPTEAQGISPSGRLAPGMSRAADGPLIAVVALSSQRLTIYSARGKVLQAPVSTGMSGYETPAGIYSVLQKRRYHYSNLYNDAAMPFMQRLTWSGIALHAGDLPGYPASHGCVRLPYGIAAQLFELSKRGMRVAVVRDDVSPVDFTHPALFRPGPMQPTSTPDQTGGQLHLSSVQGGALTAVDERPLTRRQIVAAKGRAAEAAARRAEAARRAAARAERDSAEFEDALYEAESAKKRATARIEEADLLMARSSDFADELKRIKAKAQDRLAAAQAQIDAIYAQNKDKIDALRAARDEARSADAAKAAAESEATAAVGRPVSVFISRKTQRLYVRRAFQPLFEAEIGVVRPQAPIGTTIFTAMDWADDDAGLKWTALSMYPHRGPGSPRRHNGETPQTSHDAASAALERIAIPQEAIERINALVTPGSSLIISDEGLSRETGEATDFIVLMSGEPQGGTARRRPTPYLARGGGVFTPGGFNPFSLW